MTMMSNVNLVTFQSELFLSLPPYLTVSLIMALHWLVSAPEAGPVAMSTPRYKPRSNQGKTIKKQYVTVDM
ncbi:uncharacterized protein N7473_004693 [Penicillium subrubescens]|uniref:uncharacterized protein n=1 Tax=Penicillium subrubescens TaxID=1316194 RepID=UPI00254543EC|nr:uncharacterized protein N7473_004693 [Penicillium subrubescens]KAJ5900623.1 hypothetical protein N7473_004693 [Penicillium subrubescens]